jgi:Icc-related predicted phosphoesterase
MNLLLFSDLHTDTEKTRSIVDHADDFDLLVGAGDFCHCRQRLERTVCLLRSIRTPTILVPGNSESFEELCAACSTWEAAHVLHGSGTTIFGISFFGIGGGIPTTPFGSWSYDFTEQEASNLLSGCPKDSVLVSHSPPKGTVDLSSGGLNLGSTAIRQEILDGSHPLVVCGHIHDCAGRSEYIGKTPVVNAGPTGVSWNLA